MKSRTTPPIIWTTVAVRPETKAKLDELARMGRRSIAETVAILVDEAIEKQAITPVRVAEA